MLRGVKESLFFTNFLGLIPVALQSYYQLRWKKFFPKYGAILPIIRADLKRIS